MTMDNLRFLLLGCCGSLLLQLLAGQLGMLGMLLNFLVPVPLAYASMRRGLGVGGLGALLACLAMLGLGGLTAMLAFAMQFALPAVVIAALLRRGIFWDRGVLVGTGGLLALAAVGLWFYSNSAGLDIGSLVEQYIQGEVNTALSLAGQGNLTADQTAEFRTVVEQMGRFLHRTFPAWVALVTGLMMVLQVFFLQRLSRGHYQIAGREFSRWKAPDLLIWPLIVTGFGTVFGSGPAQMVSLNILVVLLPIYFLQGLAVVSYFFSRKGIPLVLRGFGYLLIAVLNPLPIIVTGIGVFDLWADFRKPRLKKTD